MFNALTERLQTLSEQKIASLIILLSLLASSPSLFIGLLGDDLLHYMVLNDLHQLPGRNDFSLFNLFSFVSLEEADRLQLKELSFLPWWTGDGFAWNFWRPIAEITHYLDYRFFGKHIAWMHLHSLVWFALLLVLSLRLYHRLFQNPQHALLAFGFFAFHLCHAMTVAWLSNRHAIIASVFIVAATMQHWHFLQSGSPLRLMTAVTFTAMAFLSSELGVSTGVWLLGLTLFFDKRPARSKVLSLLPYLFVFLCWLYLYRLGEFGVRGHSTFYVNPMENPWRFAQYYLINLPAIVLSQTLIIPAEVFYSLASPWVALLLGYPLCFWLLWSLKGESNKSLVYFFLLVFFLLVIPTAFSLPQDRNLIQVNLAFSGLLSLLCFHLHKTYRNKQHSKAKPIVITLLALHLIISPMLIPILSYAPTFFTRDEKKRAYSLNIKPEEEVITFKAPMMETTYLYANLTAAGKPLPSKLWHIGGHYSQLEITKYNNHTLMLQALTPFFQENQELIARDPNNPPFLNQKINLNGLTITVTDIDKQGLASENADPYRIEY